MCCGLLVVVVLLSESLMLQLFDVGAVAAESTKQRTQTNKRSKLRSPNNAITKRTNNITRNKETTYQPTKQSNEQRKKETNK